MIKDKRKSSPSDGVTLGNEIGCALKLIEADIG
jgi:hypothetical protein